LPPPPTLFPYTTLFRSDEIVVSWWGRGSTEDKRLPAVIAAARQDGLAVAAHIEPYPERSVASVVADIGYLRMLGITRFFVFRPLDRKSTRLNSSHVAIS